MCTICETVNSPRICDCFKSVCTNMWQTRKMLPKKIKNSLEHGVIIVNFHWQIK